MIRAFMLMCLCKLPSWELRWGLTMVDMLFMGGNRNRGVAHVTF